MVKPTKCSRDQEISVTVFAFVSAPLFTREAMKVVCCNLRNIFLSEVLGQTAKR